MIVYGIKTCDTVRKAMQALTAAGHAPVLRDIRAELLSAEEIAEFSMAFGENLVNRSSATWRGLSAQDRALPMAALLAAQPTVMKRPVIRGATLTLGWTSAVQAAHGEK